MNKKNYIKPELKELGTVERMTQAFGGQPVQDTAFIGNVAIPGSVLGLQGSQDGILVPVP